MNFVFRHDYTPSSVFPIALAVMIGVLAEDVVKLVVAGVMARAALQELNERMSAQTPLRDLPSRPGPVDSPSQMRATQSITYESAPNLPGLLQANREHLHRACIGGTISFRESNGSSQDTTTGSRRPA